MSYLIDRQAVIDLLKQMRKDGDMVPWEGKDVFARIRKLPTIQPEKAQLSQEGTTKDATSDLIYRQAAIDAVHNSYDNILDFTSTGKTVADSIEDIISELPSAQPEPKEGHWIDKGWNGDWAWQIDGRGNCWRVIECSECGKSVSVESNYCPHCGADMRGEQDGNA